MKYSSNNIYKLKNFFDLSYYCLYLKTCTLKKYNYYYYVYVLYNKASTTQVFSLLLINTESKDIKMHFSTNIDTLPTVNYYCLLGLYFRKYADATMSSMKAWWSEIFEYLASFDVFGAILKS